LVLVLDVAKVFDSNPAFKKMMDQIKSEADALKNRIQSDQEKIRQDAMNLQNYEAGSAERNRMEAELEQRQTTLRTDARQSEQDLLNREAKVYFDTYTTMQAVVTQLAEQYDVALVLRYDSSDIDKNNRAEVIKGVNRNVVFHRNRDLTSTVVKMMNERTASTGDQIR
jgi:Skp family chaperone for outer membrane proteins